MQLFLPEKVHGHGYPPLLLCQLHQSQDHSRSDQYKPLKLLFYSDGTIFYNKGSRKKTDILMKGA